MTSRNYFGKMKPTLGSVVPLAMFFLSVHAPATSEQQKDDFTFPVLVTPKDIGDARSINAKEAPTAKRPSCPFGASCYRKNPAHRQDHAHPGDQDFLQVGQGYSGTTSIMSKLNFRTVMKTRINQSASMGLTATGRILNTGRTSNTQ